MEINEEKLHKTRHSSSKKSFRSIGVNENDTSKKQVITLTQDEYVHLPNKAYFNSDGSKINIIGHVGGAQANHYEDIRSKYAFSPLIKHLLRHRD